MSQKRSKRISTFGSRLTSIVSVSLVLLLLGLVAMAGLAGRNLTDEVRRNIGFIIKMDRDASAAQLNTVKKVLGGAPYVERYVFSSADDIMARESSLLGEDIADLVEINPYSSEYDVRVRPQYANLDSINMIIFEVRTIPGVEEIITEADVIKGVDTTFRRISTVLLIVAAVLLFISFVLISNTVSLSIYSRRFVIHTMRLVGASPAFIRRPFIFAGCRSGLVAGICASLVIAGVRMYTATLEPGLMDGALPWWPVMAALFGALIAGGIILCALASLLATSRQLRSSYDEMFLK